MSNSKRRTSDHSSTPSPLPSDSSSSYCCPCLHGCFSTQKKKKEKFAGVEYQLVPSSREGAVFDNLPQPKASKSFVLPQSKANYTVPLQLERGGSLDRRRVVTRQPMKMSRSISEPNPPLGFIPDPSMFEFEKMAGRVRPGSARSKSERTVFRHSPHSSPNTSPHHSSLSSPFSQSFPPSSSSSSSDQQTNSAAKSEEGSGVWRPSLSAIEDVEEPQDTGGRGGGGKGLTTDAAAGGSRGLTPDDPEIEYSLYYDIQCRTLVVHLQCIWDLPNPTKKVGLNPIVLLYLLPNREDIFQSKMVENSSDPIFNQSFKFGGLLPDEVRRQTLVFRVFSHSAKGNLLGGLSVSLSEADLFGVTCRRGLDTDIKKLKLVSRGDLLISLTYNPATQKLHGLLLKATNLQKQDIIGLADPYVKIWLLKKGRRNQKWKSKIKRNTLIPIFNEPFQFDLSEVSSVHDATLEILMMDYDRFSRNDVVGVVYVGDRVPHDTGRQQWEQVLSQPNTNISSWHTIMPLTSQLERTTRKHKVSKAISSNYPEEEND